MADKEYKRSRFAGMPGSVAAIRVDYARRLTAFDPPAADSHVAQIKRETRRWKAGHRLGDKLDWNGAGPDERDRLFPVRPLMHQLSEFQAVKLHYNFRSATLPQINHQTVFMPKPSKLQVDRRIFLSPEEKAKLVDRCPATVSSMCLFEMKNDPSQLPSAVKEVGWNSSTEMEKDRASLWARGAAAASAPPAGASRTGGRGGASTSAPVEAGGEHHQSFAGGNTFLALNKTKGVLNYDRYVPPKQRVEDMNALIRERKLAQREHQQGGSSGNEPGSGTYVYKMSNIDEWLRVPPEVEAFQARKAAATTAAPPAPAAAAAGGAATSRTLPTGNDVSGSN